MAKADLTAARLRELLHYDQETGAFHWRVFRSGRALPGQRAANVTRSSGYTYIFVDGYLYAAHRLAWLYVTGNWPAKYIDHADGTKSNNAFSNLREADHRKNMENQRKAHSNSKTGLLGVTLHHKNRKYQARIQVDGRPRSLGYYATAELAHAAYVEAKRRLHAGCTL